MSAWSKLTSNTINMLSEIGKGTNAVVKGVVTAPSKVVGPTTTALGGGQAAEEALLKQAKQLLSGQKNAIDTDMSADVFGSKLSDTFKGVDEGFHADFKSIGDLTTADAPTLIPNRLKDLVRKYRNDDNTTEMKGVLNDIDSFLANDFPLDGANYTSLLRKIRRLTGDVSFKAGQKTVSGTKLLSDLNQDVRGLFLEAAKRKAVETNDPELLKRVLDIDKRFGQFQSLKASPKPGQGQPSNLRQLYLTLDDPVKTASLLKGIIGNKDLGVAKVSQLKAQLKELEKVSGQKGLADDMFNNFKEVFSNKMFSKEDNSLFRGYIKDNNGLKMLESVYPEFKKDFRNWRRILNKTEDHAAMGSWMSRVFGTAIGGSAGASVGFAAGGAPGAIVGGAVGAGGLASVFSSLIKSHRFQKFALNRYSKTPSSEKEALGKLGDILQERGFDRNIAKKVLDTFTGTAVVGGVGYAGKEALEPTADDYHAEIRSMLEEDELASEKAKIEALLAP
jgi:hypothetical protein